MRGELFGGLVSLLLWASLAYGHGVTYGICDEHAMAFRFGYAGGDPMSYVEAKVFAPESPPNLEFQNGRTDARGVFAFVPDRPGPWRVEARDNLGHRGSIEVIVEQSNNGLKAGSQIETRRDGSAVIKNFTRFECYCQFGVRDCFYQTPQSSLTVAMLSYPPTSFINVYGRDPLDHAFYAHVHVEKSYLDCVHGHGWHHHHDGHDHVHAQKHEGGCDGDGACGYALASHVCDYAHAHGRAHGYGHVRGCVCLRS